MLCTLGEFRTPNLLIRSEFRGFAGAGEIPANLGRCLSLVSILSRCCRPSCVQIVATPGSDPRPHSVPGC
jgi:hypothetical protein